MRDAKRFGLDTHVYATYSGTSEDVVQTGKQSADNFFRVHFYSFWYDDSPGMADLRKITLQYHPGTEKPYGGKNYSIGWVNSQLLYEGIRRAGRNLNNEKLIDALETIREFSTEGITGPITYTLKDHAGIKFDRIYKADPASGKMIPISGWVKPPEFK